MPSLPSLPPSVYMAGLCSLAVALFLVLTKRWHGRFSMDDLLGVQKAHHIPTPRIGGVAIFFGVLAAWATATSPTRKYIFEVLILAGIPAFIFGLAEDLTKKISVGARLFATILSGVLGWGLTGVSITSVDIPYLDPILRNTFASVVFTALAVGGISNAVNIVDGFNGLASGFVVLGFCGLSFVALNAGDIDLALACIATAAAVVGFWLVNWPWGKLFLGDGGSYFCGFCLAWTSVLLVERNGSVSAFTPLLICVHPITEVLFSIYRRRLRKLSPGSPDRLHFHSLFMRRVVRPWLNRIYKDEPFLVKSFNNPLTGIVIALITVPAILMALLLQKSSFWSALACLSFSAGYVALYARLVKFQWCSPVSFLFKRSIKISD